MAYKDPEKAKEQSRKYYEEHKERIIEYNRKWAQENRYRHWVYCTLGDHKRQGCIIDISIDELEKRAKATIHCPVCGCKLKWGPGKSCDNSPTLDRINNENFINKDNIWIICHKCNTTKRNRSWKEFVEYCKHVALMEVAQ